jgi:hypothetical protein
MRIYARLRAMLRDIIAVDRLFAIQGDSVCGWGGGGYEADLLDIPGKCSASVA